MAVRLTETVAPPRGPEDVLTTNKTYLKEFKVKGDAFTLPWGNRKEFVTPEASP